MSNQSTVLFVDDEDFILKTIRKYLSNESFGLLFATSGEDALEILNHTAVSVVVSDFRMPGMTGSELLRIVSDRWPETTRIILSGYADISSVISAINEGDIYKFINKPWQGDELREVIHSAITRYHEQARIQRLTDIAIAQTQVLQNLRLDSEQSLSNRNTELETAVESLLVYREIFASLPSPVFVFYGNTLSDMNQAAITLIGGGAASLDTIPDVNSPFSLKNIMDLKEADHNELITGADGKAYKTIHSRLAAQSGREFTVIMLCMNV
jgi:FixJ family two-component response regulator